MFTRLFILLSLVGLLLSAAAQNGSPQVFRGQALSSYDHRPVPGVTISVKHKTATATTNAEGVFTILASASDTLLLSHVSYDGQHLVLPRNSSTPLRLYLDRLAKELDEVVINTGFQKLPKERATGSFTLVNEQRFQEQVGVNITERLRYIANGVTAFPSRVGSVAQDQLLIRGISTLTLSIQKPLIILDNFEYQGDIANLNPNDVESISFLKDAAAGSIWGAKAANGVIVITSKKGKYQQPTKIEFNANTTLAAKPDLFYLPAITPADLVSVEQYLFSQQVRFADTASQLHPPFSSVYEILFRQQRGLLTDAQAASQLDALRNHDVRNDFNKYLYRQAVNQQYAVNVNGGSGNMAWILSAGYDRNLSELQASYDRVNLRLDNQYKAGKKIELNTAVYFTQSKTASGRPAYGTITAVNSMLPVYSRLADEKGNALPLYTRHRQGYIDTLGGGHLLNWNYYPLEDYRHSRSKTDLQDLHAVLGINYRPLPSLTVDIKYRYEKQQSTNELLYDQQSYYNRDLVNGFSQHDPGNGAIIYKIPKGDILDLTNSAVTSHNLRGQLVFNKDWGRHSLVAIAGSELSEAIRSFTIHRTYGYNPDILVFSNVDYTTLFPHYISGANFIPNPANFGKINTRFASFFGNAAYTWLGRYTISASGRRDASNIFGLDINDKWKPLWSTGAAWHLSKESFYNLRFLPELKIRVSFGKQGNLDPGKVSATTIRYGGTTFYNAPYGNIADFVNPDLKWEEVTMLNVGIDFATRNRRISGSVEYYHKAIKDMYGPSSIDPTTGLGRSVITKNVGRMRGNGWDVQLTSININRPVKWTTDFIFNLYKDKVTRYYSPSLFGSADLVGNGGGIEGYPSFYLAVYRWAGLDPVNGDPQGYLNGRVSKDWSAITTAASPEDIAFTGPRIPVVFGSLGNTISWKNFSLTARLTYKFRYFFLRESIDYGALANSLQGHADYSLRWQQPGDEGTTTVPSFTWPVSSSRNDFYRNAAVLATKGDHIRLQYINISYSIGRERYKKLPFASLQLYGVINNIGILWRANKNKLDPDYGFLPPVRTWSFGVRAALD